MYAEAALHVQMAVLKRRACHLLCRPHHQRLPRSVHRALALLIRTGQVSDNVHLLAQEGLQQDTTFDEDVPDLTRDWSTFEPLCGCLRCRLGGLSSQRQLFNVSPRSGHVLPKHKVRMLLIRRSLELPPSSGTCSRVHNWCWSPMHSTTGANAAHKASKAAAMCTTTRTGAHFLADRRRDGHQRRWRHKHSGRNDVRDERRCRSVGQRVNWYHRHEVLERLAIIEQCCNCKSRCTTTVPGAARPQELVRCTPPLEQEPLQELVWCTPSQALSCVTTSAGATAIQRICCRNSSLRVRRRNVSAAATAVCKCDAATSLLPQQRSASVTPQGLCCRNSSLRMWRLNASAAATAVCECDAATSLLSQQQCANVTPQRLCCHNRDPATRAQSPSNHWSQQLPEVPPTNSDDTIPIAHRPPSSLTTEFEPAVRAQVPRNYF